MEFKHAPNSNPEYDGLVNRAVIYTKIRFVIITVVAITGLLASSNNKPPDIGIDSVWRLVMLAIISLLLFGIPIFISRKHHLPSQVIKVLAMLGLASDVLIYSAAIFAGGGSDSRLLILYVLPIFLTGSIFNRLAAYIVTIFTCVCYVGTIYLHNLYFFNTTPDSQQLVQAGFYCIVLVVFAGLSNYLFGLRQKREAELAQLELISLASHQLRTPTTAVKGFLSLLESGTVGELLPKQREFVRKAYDENELEINLIDNILNVASIELKNLHFEPENFDLATMINEIIPEHQTRLKSRNQTISVKHGQNQPVVINADKQLIRIVVDNLISNACKYAGQNATITILLKEKTNQVALSIEDNGPGVSKEFQKHIFKRFSRASDGSNGSTEGSGLGLYIVKKLISMHDGKIDLVSYPGEGSIFTITLPKKGI